MGDMADEVARSRKQLKNQERVRSVWEKSPFTRSNPVVGRPKGRFADFIFELKPLVPRSLWRVGYVGTSPDGLTRVTGTRFYNDRLFPKQWSIPRLLNELGLRRCRLFWAEQNGHKLIVLRDGRASYTGDLDAWRDIAPRVIATGFTAGYDTCGIYGAANHAPRFE